MTAVVTEVVTWVLGAFVVSPTGLAELRAERGTGGALAQLSLSAGLLLVVTALWTIGAVKIRAGRRWARAVLLAVGIAGLLFTLSEFSMNGVGWESALGALPLLLTATAVVLAYAPSSRPFFAS
ncbi:hypothetical protein ABTX62_11475 [Streptomyces sp. NPDC096046]|uniref:hypothetical protein n=1 Tax=Streptomyces sp. NPDC096046 TaxID=3155542 RepID=UPI0033336DEB